MSLDADTLDWSPSGISCAEEEEDDDGYGNINGIGRFVPSSSDISIASDVKAGNATGPALEEMTSLISAMQDLAASREAEKQPSQIPGSHQIPGLSLTGNVASVELGVRTVSTEETGESTLENEGEEEQERTAIHRPTAAHHSQSPRPSTADGPQNLNTTPPVRDSGPTPPPPPMQATSEVSSSLQDSAKKISEMRSLLRALEQKARSSSASSSSRIPRRSIQFNSTAKTEEEKERGLKEELAAERQRCANLERSNQTLEARLGELTARLEAAGETDARKEAAFQQVKRQWSLVSQKLAADQEEALTREAEAVSERDALRVEMAEARKQIAVCEEELGRALGLASEFRRRTEEDERVKARLEDELAAQSKAGREAEARVRKAASDAVGLRQNLERTKSDYESTLSEVRASKEESERRISKLLSTREKELSSLNSIKAELEGEREAKDALHAFYQGQVEAIVKDKVKELQAHVSQVEEAFRAERDEAVGEIRGKMERERVGHSRDLQRVASELERQKASLESSLKAARTEADCLREQLKNAEVVSQSRRTVSAVNSRSIGGQLEVNSRSASSMALTSGLDDGSAPPPSSANALLKVQNLLYPESEPEQELPNNLRMRHAPKNKDETVTSTSTVMMMSNREVSSLSSNNSLAGLTQEEREVVIQQFVRQFLEDNPSAVHDASLMSGLNSMAVKMAREQDFNGSNT